MSSIFGLCHVDKKPVTDLELGMMRGELDHWKADAANIWVDGEIGLGHLMLYNTTESRDEQLPLHNDLYGLSITSDARLDNREEIYTLLHLKTADEINVPDGFLILGLYKKYGAECVKYMIGDFAFAIWDDGEQKLFCARDHMGVKPFFYYSDENCFAFASERKGLLCLPGIDKTIDRQFLYNQVLVPIIQAADTTVYKNIGRLAPAHTLTFYFIGNRIQLNNYWTLDAETEMKVPRKEDYYDGLLHHFEEAVKCRLRSDYAVGAELSGGLDSSAITGVASSFLRSEGKSLTTFSNTSLDGNLVFAPGWEDELKYINEVNRFNDIKDVVLVKEDIWGSVEEEIDFSLWMNDGLDMWSPTWLMPIKRVGMQRNVRTFLSGFPGDEMVSYMGFFYFLDYRDKGQYSKYFSAKSVAGFGKLKPLIPQGIEYGLHKLKNIVTLNNREIRNVGDFFKMTAWDRYSKGDVVWEDVNFRERFKSYRHYQKYRLMKPQVGLRMEAETRFGLSCRSESRFPMADIRLTQFYLSMPNELKYGGALSRKFYREALNKYLPELVLQRDSKLSNIMPFKTNEEAVNKRQLYLLRLLENFKNKSIYKNVINVNTSVHTYNKLKFLEVLRWFEKNFDNSKE